MIVHHQRRRRLAAAATGVWSFILHSALPYNPPMPIVRWLSGMLKVLAGMWSTQEAAYYARTGLDPRLPAFRRWTVRLKDEAKPPETRAEELLPLRNYTVILGDEYHLAPEDMVFHTTHLDKAQAVLAQYQRELQ